MPKARGLVVYRLSGMALAALMLTAFTVSVGYGVTLPLLPNTIERLLGAGATAVRVSRHTGLLAAIYLLTLVIFAPAWGRLSDRIGRPLVLLIGLAGFALTMSGFSFLNHLWAVYFERFFSGVFAGAITPVASALVGDAKSAENGQARRLMMVSLAGMAGFLLGPMVGILTTQIIADLSDPASPRSLGIPLRSTAFLAVVSFVLVWAAIGKQRTKAHEATSGGPDVFLPKRVRQALIIFTFVVASGVGVFEMDVALRGESGGGLSPYQIALMFTECSLIMILAQMVALTPGIRPNNTRWIVVPALTILAVGLGATPYARTFPAMLAIVAVVSASAGVLAPVFTYWISIGAGTERGSELGRQTAASSLGGAVGSLLGGFLAGAGPLSNAPFVVVAGSTALAGLLSAKLLRDLKARRSESLSPH